MEITYTVSSCSEDPIAVIALVGGREVPATVMGLTVEVVNNDGHTNTFRFTPADMDAAKALFEVGETVTLTFTKPENN